MQKEKKYSSELRRRAEGQIETKAVAPEGTAEISTQEDVAKIIHELRVYQIELKMQNEELRRIQGDLEKHRDRFSHLYDHAPVGYFTLSEKGIVEETNLKAALLLGRERSTLVGNPAHLFILNEDQDIFYLSQKKLWETGESWVYKIRMVKMDESVFHAKMECIVIQETPDHPKQIRAAFSNVSEQVESEKRYQNVLETLDLIAVSLDNKGNITFCNDCLLKITGWKRDEILGKSWFTTFLPAEIRATIKEVVFQLTIKTGSFPVHYTNEIKTKNGERRLIKWSNTVLYGPQGDIIGGTSIGEDITERKRAEKRLEKSKSEWKSTFNAMGDWICLMGLDGKIHRSNAASKKILGVSHKNLIGKQCCKEVHGSDSPIAGCPLQQMIRTHVRESIEIHAPERDKDLSITTDPVFDQNGNLVSAVHIVRDITESKKTENQLKIKTMNLNEANTALKVMLEQRDREKKGLETNFAESVNGLILPYLGKIKKTRMNDLQKGYMYILESNLKEIIKPYTHRLSIKLMHLSPSETRIINYIKQGYRTKEIASILTVSPRTIEFHRENIRKKLGIKNRKINLKTYLLSIS